MTSIRSISSTPDLSEWLDPVIVAGGARPPVPALHAAYLLQRDGGHVHYVADGQARCLGGHCSLYVGSGR
ncbi:hypothetical protein ACFXKG_18355 [Streptomyces sp. NPDC059255]|uniref:hypothetical protein n=1 Tax=Streptomyces sp. NPDC059255 TaxID=3346793 RepID=UPI0036B86F32